MERQSAFFLCKAKHFSQNDTRLTTSATKPNAQCSPLEAKESPLMPWFSDHFLSLANSSSVSHSYPRRVVRQSREAWRILRKLQVARYWWCNHLLGRRPCSQKRSAACTGQPHPHATPRSPPGKLLLSLLQQISQAC